MMSDRNTSALTAASALASLAKEGPSLDRLGRPCEPVFNSTRKISPKKHKPLTFPQKLMQVLSMEEYSDIIVWLPHGKAFAIVSPREFVSEILPNFFKRAKYSSFTRKLHRWGFQRRLRGEEAGSYYHNLFQRDNEALCLKMTMTMNTRDSTENLRNAEVVASSASSSLVTGAKSVENHLNEQLDGEKTVYVHQATSYPVPLISAAQQTEPSTSIVSKSMQRNPCTLQAPPTSRQGNASRADIDAGQRALEQLLIARKLQERYQSALYSRMLMNPLRLGVGQHTARRQSLVESNILASARLAALSSNIPNTLPAINVPPRQTSVQVQTQKIVTGSYDIGALSVLSMAPRSA